MPQLGLVESWFGKDDVPIPVWRVGAGDLSSGSDEGFHAVAVDGTLLAELHPDGTMGWGDTEDRVPQPLEGAVPDGDGVGQFVLSCGTVGTVLIVQPRDASVPHPAADCDAGIAALLGRAPEETEGNCANPAAGETDPINPVVVPLELGIGKVAGWKTELLPATGTAGAGEFTWFHVVPVGTNVELPHGVVCSLVQPLIPRRRTNLFFYSVVILFYRNTHRRYGHGHGDRGPLRSVRRWYRPTREGK